MMQRRGLTINGWHTGNDGGMTMTEFSLELPEVVEQYVEVAGSSGTLDYSEATGDVRYRRRNLMAVFECSEGDVAEREQRFAELFQRFHGQRCEIICPDDQMHSYHGRVILQRSFNNLSYGQITLSAALDPFKRSIMPEILDVPLYFRGDNLITYQTVSAVPALSTAVTGIVEDTEVLTVSLVNNSGMPKDVAVFRLQLAPNSSYYVGAYAVGRGFWKLSSSPDGRQQDAGIITTDESGELYFWLYRLHPKGVFTLRHIVVMPASACFIGHNGRIPSLPELSNSVAGVTIVSVNGVSAAIAFRPDGSVLSGNIDVPAGDFYGVCLRPNTSEEEHSVQIKWYREDL